MTSAIPRRKGILIGQLKLRRKLPELSAVDLMLRRIESRELERGVTLNNLAKQVREIRQAHAS